MTSTYQVRGVSPIGFSTNDFFGPGQPLLPMAPAPGIGRILDYPMAENPRIIPRQEERVSFWDMQNLADNYDVCRLCIETRKDQMESLEWNIKPVGVNGKAGNTKEQQYRIDKTTDFFRYPDGDNPWETWLRMIIEECLVIDATSLYINKKKKGQTLFQVISGATIKRVIDEQGLAPLAPGPAYQQIIKGIPAWDYSTDELLYLPRNKRANKLYGFSPPEQIYINVNIALRRQASILQYYTDGNIPDALVGVPPEWTSQQIRDAQLAWDSMNSGNTAQRRHLRFVPGGMKYYPTKEIVLKTDFDEWLARITCFAFSIPPTAFTKMVSRASGQTMQEQAELEGITPLMRWFRGVMNRLLQSKSTLGQYDLEFAWTERDDADPAVRDKIVDAKVRRGQITINEARAVDGDDPVKGGDVPMVYAGTGPIPLQVAAAATALPQKPIGDGDFPDQTGRNGGSNQAGGPSKKPAPGANAKPPVIPVTAKPKGNGRPDSLGSPTKRPPRQKAEVDEHSHSPFSINKGELKSLYVRRNVINYKDLKDWALGQGFKTTLGDEMHVTIAFSKMPVDWGSLTDSFDRIYISADEDRRIEPLGDKGAVVLFIKSKELEDRWREFCEDFGASWDFDEYHPHISITYDAGEVYLPNAIPYAGEIILGPEIFETVNEDWQSTIVEEVHKAEPISDRSQAGAEAEVQIENAIFNAFQVLKPKAVEHIKGAIENLYKAEDDDQDDEKAEKELPSGVLPISSKGVPEEDIPAFEKALDSVLTLSLDDLVSSIEPVRVALLSTAQDSADRAALSVNAGFIATSNPNVDAFAKDRSAELVGKKVLANGDIVDNPDPHWAITDSTRNFLRQQIKDSFLNKRGMNGLIADIENNHAFSHARSTMIARTERLNAHNQGTLLGLKQAKANGIYVRKAWRTAPGACLVCIENEKAGPIELEDNFPSGDPCPTAHPHCKCALVPVTVRKVSYRDARQDGVIHEYEFPHDTHDAHQAHEDFSEELHSPADGLDDEEEAEPAPREYIPKHDRGMPEHDDGSRRRRSAEEELSVQV